MPFITGTATDYLDLLDQFVTFVTDSSAQQPPGTPGPGMGPTEVWVLEHDNTSGFTTDGEVYLKAPGLTGADTFHVNIQTFSDVPNQIFTWRLFGAIDFDNALDLTQPVLQPGSHTTHAAPRMLLRNSSMSFTIVANGRRAFIIANPVGTTIETCYLGSLRPYASPSEYPFPIFIGGMAFTDQNAGDQFQDHTFCLRTENTTEAGASGAVLRGPSGAWYRNKQRANDFLSPMEGPQNLLCVWPGTVMNEPNEVVTTDNGDHVKFPARCAINTNSGTGNLNNEAQLVGELDGVFWVSGFSINTADILQESGIDYEVFQNASRSGTNDFGAVKRV